MKKFNEMTTDETLDILCEITPHVSNIVEDKELVKIFAEKVKLDDKTTDAEFKEKTLAKGIEKMVKFIPLILKKHREDVFNIISVLNGKSVDEIRTQKVTTTVKEIKEMLMDKDLVDFFTELVK